MRSTRSLARAALAAVCALMTSTASAQTDTEAAKNQRIEGVVIKVEPARGNDRPDRDRRRVRLTINTAAVWRDYVRDTAASRESSPEKAAQKGDESVATKGQPKERNTLVTVEITPDSKLELRYRAAMDERSLGAGSIEAARRLTNRDADDTPPSNDEGSPGQTAKIDQLKPGLFVHIRYHRAGEQDRADRVVVLEPVRDEPGK